MHNLGHNYESCQNLLKLVPENHMGILSSYAKFQLSNCSQLGVMRRPLSEIDYLSKIQN